MSFSKKTANEAYLVSLVKELKRHINTSVSLVVIIKPSIILLIKTQLAVLVH